MLQIIILVLLSSVMEIPSYIQPTEKVKEILFTTGSRAFRKTVSITNKQMIISRKNALSGEDQTIESSISKQQWKNLIDTFSKESLTELENLPSPTMERARDAANYSSIRIITDQKTYNCGSFDDHNPHKKLKPMLKAILDLSY